MNPKLPPKGKVQVRYSIPAGYKFEENSATARRKSPKVQPNVACPCGSGKKAKHCHWKR